MSTISNNSKKGEKKYSKLLNNLLLIKSRDQALFTKVNNTEIFDINSKFGEEVSKKILGQKTFNLEIKEKDIQSLINEVSRSEDYNEIINAYEKYKFRLFNKSKILLQNEKSFSEEKNELLKDLKEKKQKEKTRWKLYRRKVYDLNAQENIWALHVGTLFIKFVSSKKEIYAPLILKECQLEINENNVKLKSEENWKINEKLIFMLEEEGYIFDNSKFDEIIEIDEIKKYFLNYFNVNELDFEMSDEFKNIKREDILNRIIEFQPGAVLGLFKPSGGHLRKTMQEIIKKDILDEIIDANPDKSVYDENVENYILNKSSDLIRIQKSNFSQDKALISSLIQNTVIWGPPGTGKSQVIANIIANILENNKTAIVMSQKKAALDVLKKRLNKISFFVLFILNDNKMDKQEFYTPLQEFVKHVENRKTKINKSANKIIEKQDIDILNFISETKNNNKYLNSLKIMEIFKDNWNLLSNAFNLSDKWIYPEFKDNEKKFLKDFYEINKIIVKKVLGFKIYSKKYKELCRNAISIINESNIKIDSFIDLIGKTDLSTLLKLKECEKLSSKMSNIEMDEDYLVNILSERILSKINSWKYYNKSLFDDYKRFANAARAARRIPYKFLNDHISIIKELFPIIVTTPETTFINWERNYFDFAVLDESSQMFIEIGLPILYLSKIKILAGDPQQMQPTSWFETRDQSDEEEDVAENANSLLDYVRNKGVYEIMLNQNYRSSSASLMSFSSKNFYNSDLEVIDDEVKKEQTSIEVENINGIWEKGINIKEAKRAIEVVNEELTNYKKIILLTFNSDQRQIIEKEILEKWPNLSKAIEDEQLTVRNIENIQGDEADLVVVSIVYDPNTNISSTYVARAGGKNALNVAISRAKEKMIVLKSIDTKNIKSGKSEDFQTFYKWLNFLDMSYEEKTKYSKKDKFQIEESFGEVDSKFERDVLEFIKERVQTHKKTKIIKQYEVGSYSIDLAIVNEKGKFILGIEVDGYAYHEGQGYDKYLSDLSRQSFLETKGYPIFRVKEIDFKINKKKLERQLNNLLEELI
ncbi:hypothetical protein CG006_01780 [Mesoplasma florum]|uniref:AAA domain-containing protein n=1 Tax=Mesoplasma florum TaxID=2151 RepID=UPI000D040F2B|nr:AAA domain-containing protein [Mesoplasma florum]AVN63707.1 hypothetical protein CG006_01780 [Mesoplasma florum]